MSRTIESICTTIKAVRTGNLPARISWLLTDSRSLLFPDETLFFALRTRRNDGHNYIAELYERGVRNFVTLDNALAASCPDANFLVVPNVLKALQMLAEHHRATFNAPVVGITGSNGKTVVKEWLYQLLSPEKVITRSPLSYNSQIGVPLSVWMMNEQTELAIFEAGISGMNEMQNLQPIINPTIGIITNIGGAHQENFYSLREKCMEKLSLFEKSDIIIYNGDDPLISECVGKSLFGAKEIAWSVENTESPLYISKIDKGAETTTVSYRYIGFQGSYTIPFIDNASVENSIHCLAIALYMMLTPETIAQRMARLEPVAMRLEVKEGKNGCTLINDSYNADLSSLGIAMDFMGRRNQKRGQRKTLILSDLLQTGQNSKLLYRQVADLVNSNQIDKLIGVGSQIALFSRLFNQEKYFFQTTNELLQSPLLEQLHNELVLIKGSRIFQFDHITDAIELKVHETILEVNLNALVENLNWYRNQLRPDTRMVCMVKASAYGAGALEVAKTLQEHRVDYLAVATADEGADLRKAGITANIIVMNPEMTSFKTLFDNQLEPEVYSFRLIDGLIKTAEKEGANNIPIHIKIDTGMHRLGFSESDMPQLIARLRRQTAVFPRSVFSHFVGSDCDEFDAFSQQQFECFDRASTALQQAFTQHIIRHICNTAGIERFPGRQLDMVRLGLGLYGIDPSTNQMLHTVSTLKTTILQIHNVSKGESVGYSRRSTMERDSRIATIPIGYADGLNRKLGNRNAYCLVNGQKAPYVGNICMDACMIDVTDIACNEGDEVEIFGNKLPVTELSRVLDTIPYEVLTGISTRVKHVYYQN
ncbi:MAG: bifunctional UDP-N-acetylmuramoyl-tripeptide:D-alanyl-D-alanine ligase/alanine racemase [Bacteroidales bacterium]|nr:bifunctional UDP-N-acetylmuramoyl-tripeptide:D-alanyl-D-alanine ligase/alanine racemase [Bacteroidales bacterium]